MDCIYKPEGTRIKTEENREYLACPAALERAMNNGAIIEGMVTLCDSQLRLHVDLGCAVGIIEPEDAVFCRAGETRKDIALISRVGRPIAARILSMENRGDRLIVRLSRRLAQQSCIRYYLSACRPGDIIPARVSHLEPFGAFVDIGCGVSSLLSVDCISVSRISHPRDRLRCGDDLSVVIKSIDHDSGRIYVSLREMLGTWEENARLFEAGQTVTGIIRSVESYGVFIELTPNLAGLAEVKESVLEEMRQKIGHSAAVYIKSIVPDRMKIKLILINVCAPAVPSKEFVYYIDPKTTPHIAHWRYSPINSRKTVETCFEEVI